MLLLIKNLKNKEEKKSYCVQLEWWSYITQQNAVNFFRIYLFSKMICFFRTLIFLCGSRPEFGCCLFVFRCIFTMFKSISDDFLLAFNSDFGKIWKRFCAGHIDMVDWNHFILKRVRNLSYLIVLIDIFFWIWLCEIWKPLEILSKSSCGHIYIYNYMTR